MMNLEECGRKEKVLNRRSIVHLSGGNEENCTEPQSRHMSLLTYESPNRRVSPNATTACLSNVRFRSAQL
jgi:hypothetical protein